MGLNKKIPKSIRIYAVASQYSVFLLVLTYLSYYLGDKLDKNLNQDAFYSGIFGVIGIVIGITLLIKNVLKLNGDLKKDGKD